ncbi:MAG: DUF4317 domain-containing protein [Mollicutes bacterium]|uniref:DUF4317 domain-containing protein n=1 Tax=Clostridium sp. TaxID=1506 RepID=UPI0026739D11|nr:DUF4317 domain-containing protein [Clostridium sp.]MCI7030819.1 DUF4317 domain-containing protein [Clostridium sp.]MCI7225226.1 DUF4317 domain-containing protein [Mollicutes bacterium]
MNKKDILELKKRFKKNNCTFTKMCGCYVNGEKNILLKFRETFLNLEEDDYFKYLEIAKKVLSGTMGNNLLELNFPLNDEYINERQISLMELKKSQLKDDSLLDDFYKLIIENYHYTGNFLILIFHDAYDIITKTTDNAKLDESEEVYEYILCAICPVELSKAGLRYFEDENAIKSRVRDWVVEAPVNGFVFPAFIDRGADVNSIIYYTKNAKDPHPELMEEALGCTSKQTATEQKETFNGIIKNALGSDEKKSNHFFMEIQESLNNKIEEHNTVHEDSHEPILLTNNVIQEILTESGVPEEITTKIEKSYTESFGDTPPLAETLLDNKALAAKAQKRKEEMLERQVKILETKLERFKHNVSEETATDSNEDILENEVFETITNSESIGEDLDYDIVLKVKPEKVSQIKSEVIDGKKYLVIPIDEDEQANVNGIDNLI